MTRSHRLIGWRRDVARAGMLAATFLPAVGVSAEDWPTHRHDARRSGISTEKIDAARLKLQWTWRSPARPQPAWDGPAKWDAFAKIPRLGAMRDYDEAFGMAVTGGSLYVGSSADDSLHCLDAATGRERWTFTADGPVRIAPTVADGVVCFGSDDGYAYGVAADSGRLVWKHCPAPDATRILHNGRLISPYPCRTGVVVKDRTGYFAAGLLPWETAYVCAVDLATGKPRYVREHRLTPEGAALIAGDRLIVPQGRVAPVAIDRADGNQIGRVGKGQGGSFAVVGKGDRVYYGQTSKTSSIASQDKEEAFKSGRRLVLTDETAFVTTGTELVAIDAGTSKPRWKQPCPYADALILAGDTLLVGGRDAVVAVDPRSGRTVWQAGIDGRVCDLAAAGGRLYASTSEGVIACYGSGGGRTPARPVTPERPKPTPTNRLALGPFVEYTGPDTAVVRWDGGPSSFQLAGGAPRPMTVRGTRKGGIYEAKLTDLRPDTVYTYTFAGTPASGFELDTAFNYRLKPAGDVKGLSGDASAAATARRAIADAATDRGICVVAGEGIGRTAAEIARLGRFRVIGVETAPDRVPEARKALMAAGIYGSRVVIRHAESLEKLPFVGEFANLLVWSGPPSGEIERLLVPGTGVALVRDGAGWTRKTRPPLERAGVWTHQYGLADNAAYGGEWLNGAASTGDFHVQWIGRPGPRYQPDRNGRKPAPLAVNGRLFGQGLQRIVALDAYNGTILWSLEIPPLGRFNIPRDCGNWCADKDSLYVAVRDRCWVLDAAGGLVSRFLEIPTRSPKGWRQDWGYVADGGELLVGSAVKQGSAFMDFWGGASQGWYDAVKGRVTHKVCSDALFALDKKRGGRRWDYAGGLILNSTITLADGVVYFVQCRNRAVLGSDSRVVGEPGLWQHQELVALDLESGKTRWRKPIDTADGEVMFHMASGGGRLVIVSSTPGKAYEITAFDAADGSQAWRAGLKWPGGKGDHGKAMARPAIVGDKVFVRPGVYDLKTGTLQDLRMPGGGCGTYAFSTYAAIFRDRTVTLWSFDGNKKSGWNRLRPGCWLSTVPALGMVLSLEAGGGCKCAGWMETSIVFMPNGVTSGGR